MAERNAYAHVVFFLAMMAMQGMLAMQGNRALAQNGRAQSKPNQPVVGKALCVDVVSLRQGKSVRGLIINSSGDAWLMAVEREVLKADLPELYRQAANAERQLALSAWQDLAERIKKQLDAKLAAPPIERFFRSELERVEKALAKLAAKPDGSSVESGELDYRFVWVELAKRQVSAVKQASTEAKRVAMWAWSESLSDVHKRDQADLQKELSKEKIDFRIDPPDLSGQLAPRPESDESWATRLAIVRHSLGKPLAFQGAKGVYLQSGGAVQPLDLAALISKLMGSDLESLLADLDPSRKSSGKNSSHEWLQPMIAQAEELKHEEFRVTRLDLDPNSKMASVDVALVVHLPTKGWQVVISTKHQTSESQVDATVVRQVAEDPQVKAALSLLSGLGVNAENEIQRAIRFGAATMSAQKTAESRFSQHLDRYIRRLDGPPLEE